MGKGDQRSRRGKLYRGTFGKSRPRKGNKNKKKVTARGPLAASRSAAAAAAAAKKAPRKTTPPPASS